MFLPTFRNLFAALSVATLLPLSSAHAAVFSDDFTGSPDAAWTTDRYEPNGFATVSFDGGDRLQISISEAQGAANRGGQSAAFYNTQGRSVAVGSIPEWSVSADLFVSSDMVSGNNLRRTDLWARTGDVGSEPGASYPIIGLRRFDPADAFNAAASNISSAWRVWDGDVVGGWVNLAAAVDEGWNTLAMSGNSSEINFFLNGNLVYTDSTIVPAVSELTNVYLQGYNFNQVGSGQDYVAHWDNVVVNAVPEPASLALAGAAALGLFVVRRRNAKA